METATGQAIHPSRGNPAIWIGLIASSGVVLSSVFACVTPFAALGTLAALKLGWRHGLGVVGLVWLANQAIGFGLLGYPWTWDSLSWGAAIGVSAGLAVTAATALSSDRPAPLAISLPFVAAFTAFELTLYTVGFILPGSDGTFRAAIVSHIFLVNAATLCALPILYHVVVLAAARTRLNLLVPNAAASSR